MGFPVSGLRASRLSVLQSGVKSASAARADGPATAIAPRHATALNSFAFNRHMGRDTIKTRAIYECGRASMAIGPSRAIIVGWMDHAPACRPSFRT